MKHFILAITFLTRIYIPHKHTYSEDDFAKSIWYYPFVGVILGCLLGGATFLLESFDVLPEISAFILLVLYIGLSGGLHLDGLADVCDGIFSSRSREKIFEIMKDSHVGTFGVIGLMLYFLGMWLGLKYANWQMCFLFPVIGRCAILVTAGMSQYAKESGLGKSIVDTARGVHILFAIGIALLTAGLLDVNLLIPVVCSFLIVFLLTKRVSKTLQGITGDGLGMMVEVSQCAFLLLGVLL